MIKNALANWKTTSAGLTIMIGAFVHLVFAIIHGTADENVWTTSLLAILAGFGLILAGDSSKSAQDVQKVDAKANQTINAVASGDTASLPDPTPVNPPPPNG